MQEKLLYHRQSDLHVSPRILMGEVLYYPDLIKISVALDNGEILKYEATGYVMNHHSRDAFPASLSIDEAERKVSPHLEVQTHKTAVVPTPAGEEVCCYEFLCRALPENRS